MANNEMNVLKIGNSEFEIADAAARQDVSQLKEDLDDVETALETKAEIDGYYESMTVGNAEQLVATVGIEDKVPYLFRTSGGSADIGDREVDKIVGGTIAWNQQLKNGNFANGTTNWIGSSAILTVTDGVARCTLDGDAWNNDIRQVNATVIDGHIYLIGALVRQSSTDFSIMFRNPGGQGASYYFSGTGWTRYATFIKVTSSAPNGFALSVRENGTTLTDEWFEAQNINCFDLTQMFGSTIADYIYSLEQATAGAGVAWFKKLFPKDYYEYNAGELLSVSDLQSHDTVGFNQWDEEWELGAINPTTGQPYASSTSIRCKNFIPVLPNTAYCYHNGSEINQAPWFYDAEKNFVNRSSSYISTGGVFTIPDNVHYMKFALPATYGITYKNDICINLHWDGERDGEYEAYTKHSYPLDSDLVLRGIPKLDASNSLYYDGDVYESDGTVTRKYGVITFDGSNDENWMFYTWGNNVYRSYIAVSDIITSVPDNARINAVCDKNFRPVPYMHTVTDRNVFSGRNNVAQINFFQNKAATLADWRTWLASNPITVVYELATPTTESADAFQNPQVVDDFGTEEYVTTSIVPVGHETTYQANLRAKLEMSPDSPSDGDGDYIVRQTNGGNEYVKLVIPAELPSNPSTAGTYTLKVTVPASGTPTLAWVADT